MAVLLATFIIILRMWGMSTAITSEPVLQAGAIERNKLPFLIKSQILHSLKQGLNTGC